MHENLRLGTRLIVAKQAGGDAILETDISAVEAVLSALVEACKNNGKKITDTNVWEGVKLQVLRLVLDYAVKQGILQKTGDIQKAIDGDLVKLETLFKDTIKSEKSIIMKACVDGKKDAMRALLDAMTTVDYVYSVVAGNGYGLTLAADGKTFIVSPFKDGVPTNMRFSNAVQLLIFNTLGRQILLTTLSMDDNGNRLSDDGKIVKSTMIFSEKNSISVIKIATEVREFQGQGAAHMATVLEVLSELFRDSEIIGYSGTPQLVAVQLGLLFNIKFISAGTEINKLTGKMGFKPSSYSCSENIESLENDLVAYLEHIDGANASLIQPSGIAAAKVGAMSEKAIEKYMKNSKNAPSTIEVVRIKGARYEMVDGSSQIFLKVDRITFTFKNGKFNKSIAKNITLSETALSDLHRSKTQVIKIFMRGAHLAIDQMIFSDEHINILVDSMTTSSDFLQARLRQRGWTLKLDEVREFFNSKENTTKWKIDENNKDDAIFRIVKEGTKKTLEFRVTKDGYVEFSSKLYKILAVGAETISTIKSRYSGAHLKIFSENTNIHFVDGNNLSPALRKALTGKGYSDKMTPARVRGLQQRMVNRLFKQNNENAIKESTLEVLGVVIECMEIKLVKELMKLQSAALAESGGAESGLGGQIDFGKILEAIQNNRGRNINLNGMGKMKVQDFILQKIMHVRADVQERIIKKLEDIGGANSEKYLKIANAFIADGKGLALKATLTGANKFGVVYGDMFAKLSGDAFTLNNLILYLNEHVSLAA